MKVDAQPTSILDRINQAKEQNKKFEHLMGAKKYEMLIEELKNDFKVAGKDRLSLNQ